jgi:hypothetical protein
MLMCGIAVVVAVCLGGGRVARASQPATVEGALGTWRSVEQFEGESRLSFSFRRRGTDITGWAVLLGQRRKSDNRATLLVTFQGVTWNKDRLTFETMLPEDGGTIGWELRVTGSNRATLVAVAEDGVPFDEAMTWPMTK